MLFYDPWLSVFEACPNQDPVVGEDIYYSQVQVETRKSPTFLHGHVLNMQE